MSRAVLISIRPKWVEKILSGEKTIEVRKTRPKLETPFKCYIYETQGKRDTPWIDEDGHMIFRGRGKVVGEFTCDTCDRVEAIKAATGPYGIYAVGDDFVAQTRLVNGALWDYGKGATLYGWHISELKVYDAPKPLSEFWFPDDLYCEKELCGGCPWDQSPDINGEYEFDCGWRRPLRRPPQSWCYVEEL